MSYKPPYFLLYVNDLMGSHTVDLMDSEQFGWYMKLLIRSWQWETPCHLPDDMDVLRSILRVGRRAREIATFQERFAIVYERFSKSEDGKSIFHPKLLEQYRELLDRHKRQVDGGKSTRLALGKLPANQGGKQGANQGGKQEVSRGYPDPEPDPEPKKKPVASLLGKRGTRIPEDFSVSEEHRQFAREKNLPDPDLVIQEFCDYWKAKPGSGGLKLDWDATFRVWLSRSTRYGVANGKISRSEERQREGLSNIAKALRNRVSEADGEDPGAFPKLPIDGNHGDGLPGGLGETGARVRDGEVPQSTGSHMDTPDILSPARRDSGRVRGSPGRAEDWSL